MKTKEVQIGGFTAIVREFILDDYPECQIVTQNVYSQDKAKRKEAFRELVFLCSGIKIEGEIVLHDFKEFMAALAEVNDYPKKGEAPVSEVPKPE